MKEAPYSTSFVSGLKENDVFACKKVTLHDLDIVFREYGLEHDPVIILLHSFGSSSAMFEELQVQHIKGYRIIAPDYPGFGGSSGKPGKHYDFDELTCFIEDFINIMGFNDRPTYLLDFVIPIGLRLCLKYPQKIKFVLFAELSSSMAIPPAIIPDLNLEQLLSISPNHWPAAADISCDHLFCSAKMIVCWSPDGKGERDTNNGINFRRIAFLLQNIFWVLFILNLTLIFII